MTHYPRKRFGQNFLHDERILHAIVSAVSPKSSDHLVEIGPGQGALTELLLPECGRLDVVELDRDLVTLLHKKFATEAKIVIHSGDALNFDFASLGKGEPLRIIGNLPYNISTPLLFHLFAQGSCIRDMHFMLQKEVVDRLCAQPGSKDYGRLGVMASYYCAMEPLMEVPPESFYPQPKVISSVVRLIPHEHKPVDIPAGILQRIVSTAFSQRRKTLRNALGNLFSESEIRKLGIDPGKRPESLGLKEFALLGKLLLESEPIKP